MPKPKTIEIFFTYQMAAQREMKKSEETDLKPSETLTLTPPPQILPQPPQSTSFSSRPAVIRPLSAAAESSLPPIQVEETVPAATANVKRCGGCRRKVGLMGFRCRCGGVFCGEHRYSDRHTCGYDYKSAAREAIARANPAVRPSKVVKI
ncbi:Zinc finger A20 and AN1 domain-containing stress-associated protein 5 [Acorus calamus]|uniref:Zinc finger A20 and AN1 domain-containing stress-associated protein 5 n=1 Tax=Acorus calamus TaxID=4465 RepID=A0AAV9DYH3_ACOCL|nr:Zinc finger A20 and AN1 domain-containing stress-associated protein 5 [Acorus calamus]